MLDSLAQHVMYEPDTCSLLTSVLRDGDTFVDVGTHVGFFSSLAASLVGNDGRVVSFEPEARNFGAAQRSRRLNGFANVDRVNAAVGAEEGQAEFWVNADNDGGHALWNVGNHGYNQLSRAARESSGRSGDDARLTLHEDRRAHAEVDQDRRGRAAS